MNNAGAFKSGGFGEQFNTGRPGAGFRGGVPGAGFGMGRFYSALGLKPGASDQEIKTAYRKEAMKWHPDKYRGNNKQEAERKFREVTDAYNALTGK